MSAGYLHGRSRRRGKQARKERQADGPRADGGERKCEALSRSDAETGAHSPPWLIEIIRGRGGAQERTGGKAACVVGRDAVGSTTGKGKEEVRKDCK